MLINQHHVIIYYYLLQNVKKLMIKFLLIFCEFSRRTFTKLQMYLSPKIN